MSDADDTELSVCDETQQQPLKEPDISTVNYDFIKTGKSQGLGVLVTHNHSFRYYVQNRSVDKSIIW